MLANGARRRSPTPRASQPNGAVGATCRIGGNGETSGFGAVGGSRAGGASGVMADRVAARWQIL